MRCASDETITRAKRAKIALKKRLRRHPNVVAIGVGYRERGGRVIQRVCIRVHVNTKFAQSAVPKALMLPRSVRGFQIDVVQSRYRGQAGDPTARFNPLVGGIVVANARRFDEQSKIGTAGCIFRNAQGERLLLSNWHVLYGEAGVDGERVTQPLPFEDKNDIGFTKKGIISSRVDCAVVELSSDRTSSAKILGISGAVLKQTKPRVGLFVKKSGANGIGRGVIVAVNLDPTVLIDGTFREFTNQIEIVPRPGESAADLNSEEGDSGALWISEDDSRIVGLHFAGDTGRVIANPIAAVVAAFGAQGVDIGL